MSDHHNHHEDKALEKIANAINRLAKAVECICHALQPPKAKSAKLVITPNKKEI